jgi:hypothetical protein
MNLLVELNKPFSFFVKVKFDGLAYSEFPEPDSFVYDISSLSKFIDF